MISVFSSEMQSRNSSSRIKFKNEKSGIMLFYIKEKYDPLGQKAKNMLPFISASAFKGWQTG